VTAAPTRVPLFIDGQPRDGAAGAFPLVFPVTGETVGEVAHASAADVDDAVAAARRALGGPWGQLDVRGRARLLHRVADGIEARFEAFLQAEVRDTGKPTRFARSVDIPRAAANFRIFADMIAIAGDHAFYGPAPGGEAVNITHRGPLGVVAVVCPWNLPLLLMTWKVAPALAAGNTVVVKPSEETPTTATLLAEVMRDAGVPDGVYNVVHGFGPGSAGEALVAHDDVDAVTFTGESRTGQAIMAASAPGLKKLSFELGGKNAALVFDDADLDAAIAGTVRSAFANCGQICLNTERVYVQRAVYDRFVAGLAEATRSLAIGDPRLDGTGLGPLISAEQQAKVRRYQRLAVQAGATAVVGGGVPALDGPLAGGFFVEPTVWTGLDEDAAPVREEIFGPVCHVAPFDDEAHAVALANASDYGLCAAVWTGSLDRAHRVGRALDVGIAWVNTWFLRDLRTPFGGVGKSGIGREGGAWSLDFYTEVRNLCIYVPNHGVQPAP
jgi:aminomuconate-semialdehyde/2-hydroxymuconate-6-semialdehyde dehydrogenase